MVCKAERVVTLFKAVEAALLRHTGIACNLEETRVWNRAGVVPAEVATLGVDVWVGGDECPPAMRGVKVLGAPVGAPEFVQEHGREKLAEEQKLWTC